MSTEIQVDDETRAALLLFNERVEANAAHERGAKRVAKAEREKDEAAAKVRKLGENPNASAEDKAAAEAEYKAAVDNFQAIKADPTAGDKPKKAAPAPDDAPDAEETAAADTTATGPADAPAAEETAPADTTATGPDDAPAAEETAPSEVSADEVAAATPDEAVSESE